MGSPLVWLHLTLSDLERSMPRSLRFWKLISLKGAAWVRPYMLLLSINRKPYMGGGGSPMTLSHLTLKGQLSRSHRLQRLISCKAAELGHMLLLNTNRKSCMGSTKSSWHLTLSDLERSKLRCWIWSKIDTCIVRYCVIVNPRFQLI